MLADKSFLFVEDDVQSIYYFRKALLNKGAKSENVVVVESLQAAIEIVSQESFDYIFIDLYCAPSCPELKKYENLLGEPEFNHGQLLGLWLDDKKPQINYGYITQIPALAKPVNDIQATKPIFNKNQLTSLDFVNKVISLLNINQDSGGITND